MRLGFLFLIAVLFAALWAGCSSFDEDTKAELRALNEQQRAVWEVQGFADYVLTYQRSCLCPADVAGPFDVVVRGGIRESASYRDEPIGADSLDRYFTVEGLFDFIEQALATNPDRASLRYEPERGFPVTILIDYDVNRSNDEDALSVSNVAALTDGRAGR